MFKLKNLLLIAALFVGINGSAFALAYSTTVKAGKMNAIGTAVGNAGTLIIYNGTQPATCGTATTALATFTLGSPFAPTTATATISPNLPAVVTASNTSTATWFRVSTSGASCMFDGTVGTSGSDLNLATTALVTGLTVSITSWTMTSGN